MQEMETKTESYEELKEILLERIGDINADVLKTHFQSLIDSERTFCIIKSVRDLITILEERDFINEDNLGLLDNIFEFCKTDNLLTEEEINDMEGNINFHRKVHDCPDIDKCQICSKVTLYMEELVNATPSAPELSPTYLNNSHQIADRFSFQNHHFNEIDAIIRYISECIGKDWRPFVSFLGVKEKKIQDLYNKYDKQNKVCAAAFEALLEWKERSSRKTDDEKKHLLIHFLRRRDIYFCSSIADDIINGEHLKHQIVKI